MSLRFVLGKSGSGKTDFCLTEALTGKNKSIMIVPEQYSFTAEKLAASKTSIYGFDNFEILSFKRLAHRILPISKGAAKKRLDSGSKAILIQKILIDNYDNLSMIKRQSQESGVSAELSKLFGELKRYSVNADSFIQAAEELKNEKLLEIGTIYKAYENYIKDSFIDSDDDLQTLSALLLSYDFIDGADIYLDSFEGFTPSEFLCLESLLLKASRVTVTLCYTPQLKGRCEFYPIERTYNRIISLAEKCGVKTDDPVILKTNTIERTPEISYLLDNYFDYPTSAYDKPTENIQIFAASNPLGEVRFAAASIIKLCRDNNLKFRDIAVTGRNLDKYEKYISTVFQDYGITCYLDRKRSILLHPLTVFLFSALEIIIKGYNYNEIFRYIKSGFLHIRRSDADILENYVLATGIRGAKWKAEEVWNVRERMFSDSEQPDDDELSDLIHIDKIRRKISDPIEKFRKALVSGKTAREKCIAVYDFMNANKVKRRLLAYIKLFEYRGNVALAAEYGGIYNDLITALSDICNSFGDDNISIKNFYNVLRSGLGSYKTGIIPATLDYVSVGNLDRIKGYKVKALFILGINDGIFPASVRTDGLLSDADRKALEKQKIETAPCAEEKVLCEDFLIYKSFSLAEEKIYFTYPMSEIDGTSLRPSLIIQRLKDVFPKIKTSDDIFSVPDEQKIINPAVTTGYVLSQYRSGTLSDEMLAAYSWLLKNSEDFKNILLKMREKKRSENLSEEIRKKILGNNLYTTVSRLERFSMCPFSYFVQYTLGAQERKICEMMPTDAGSYLHGFIDEFSKRLKKNNASWKSIDENYIDKEIDEISSLFAKRLNSFILEDSPRFKYMIGRLQRIVKRSIIMISKHIKCGKFEPLGYEISFDEKGGFKPLELTLPNGGKVSLTGRIDRADSYYSEEEKTSFVRIIDYKSGSKDFDINDVFHGLNLQLAVYLTAICENNSYKPAGILYYMLDDPVPNGNITYSADDAESAKEKALKLKGLILNDENMINIMDEQFVKSSDYFPVKITGGEIKGGCNAHQFEVLSEYVKKEVTDLSNALLSGVTQAIPYSKGEKTPCEYCSYRQICHFDGSETRIIEKESEQEIWQKMEARINGN